MTEQEKRIQELELIIDEIDGALCNYCNTVGDVDVDTDAPYSAWDEAIHARFKELCDAYNLWHNRRSEIGEITQKYFKQHGRYAMILREIAYDRFSTRERLIQKAKEAVDATE